MLDKPLIKLEDLKTSLTSFLVQASSVSWILLIFHFFGRRQFVRMIEMFLIHFTSHLSIWTCQCFSDFFRGPEVKQIRLAGLEHVILVSAIDGKILARNYR